MPQPKSRVVIVASIVACRMEPTAELSASPAVPTMDDDRSLRAPDASAAARADMTTATTTPRSAAELLAVVDGLRAEALGLEHARADDIARCPPATREGLRNLLHYLALRRHDLRQLQRELVRHGLSSLGRMESHVMATLDAVGRALAALAGRRPAAELADDPRFDLGESRLRENALDVFGPEPATRATRIMVTLPSEAATDAMLVHDLVVAGTDLVRINAAHDDPNAWVHMVERVRAAEIAVGRSIRIAVDLAGPKLRTAPFEPGQAVLKLRPERDPLGRMIAPARVRLVPNRRPPPVEAEVLPVDPRLLHRVRVDDVYELVDARGRSRRLRVAALDTDGCPICEADRTVYLVPGTVLLHRRGKRKAVAGEVGDMRPAPGEVVLVPGDRIDLVEGDGPGHPRRIAIDGRPAAPAIVACDVPEIFKRLQPGHRVLFDDGRITTTVREIARSRAVLEVQHCAGGRARLRAEKGINLPDTVLTLSALTPPDLETLRIAVAQQVDLVSASFVQRVEDVVALRAELDALGAAHVGIVLKIETATAFARLPELLMAALAHAGGVAVMVARGDLAVEVGFERLAEVQEEVLWLCEAAHVPVIWATQVLDGLAHDGVPSRAEVTDAAMSGRAECVMLNKGPFIVETLAFLADVLGRMRSHQTKKSSMLRALAVSDRIAAPTAAPLTGTDGGAAQA